MFAASDARWADDSPLTDDLAEPMGPLALAASAARAEAEARIRALAGNGRGPVADDHYHGDAEDLTPALPVIATDVLEPLPRPKTGSGAHARRAHEPEGEPGPDSEQADPIEGRPGPSTASVTRRSRVTRGYSIPRMTRAKRPGAVPGIS